jgi:hypothetical protein
MAAIYIASRTAGDGKIRIRADAADALIAERNCRFARETFADVLADAIGITSTFTQRCVEL